MAKLEAKLGMIFDSVGNFFSGNDQLPWCDSDIVAVSSRFLLFHSKILHLLSILSDVRAGNGLRVLCISSDYGEDLNQTEILNWASFFLCLLLSVIRDFISGVKMKRVSRIKHRYINFFCEFLILLTPENLGI